MKAIWCLCDNVGSWSHKIQQNDKVHYRLANMAGRKIFPANFLEPRKYITGSTASSSIDEMSMPRLYYKGCDEQGETNSFIERLVKEIPHLQKKYKPPAVWGSNAHIHTAVGALHSRKILNHKSLPSRRHYLMLPDGSTVTYDIFTERKEMKGDNPITTLLLCPGLGGSSKSYSARAFALQATMAGYRVVVLNHLGTVGKSLTSPRIFTLGSTEEYGAMVKDILKKFPTSKLIAVGFSMGANLVCKYLGENLEIQNHFVACVSVCQGYDYLRMKKIMDSPTQVNRFYEKQLGGYFKRVLNKHWDTLKYKVLQPEHTDRTDALSRNSRDADINKLLKSNGLRDVDKFAIIKLTGHKTIEDYYIDASSCHLLHNINLPTLFVNAEDDPLHVQDLYQHPMQRARTDGRTLFVLTAHGGHMGFFTKSGCAMVDPTTWLEEMLIQYLDSVVNIHQRSSEQTDGESLMHLSNGIDIPGGVDRPLEVSIAKFNESEQQEEDVASMCKEILHKGNLRNNKIAPY